MKLPTVLELDLLSVLTRPATGVEIMREYHARTRSVLSKPTLYTTLTRMADREWVIQSVGGDDRRLRYYQVSSLGRQAYRAGRLRLFHALRRLPEKLK